MDYTYDELKESIKQENLIGEGGFGKVYKGSARSTSIAVKVLFEVAKYTFDLIIARVHKKEKRVSN